MKKMISLIVAALLATVVASGCKGLAECKDTQDEKVCNEASNFNNKFCTWDAKESDKAKACKEDHAKRCAAVKVDAKAEKAAQEKTCTDAKCGAPAAEGKGCAAPAQA